MVIDLIDRQISLIKRDCKLEERLAEKLVDYTGEYTSTYKIKINKFADRLGFNIWSGELYKGLRKLWVNGTTSDIYGNSKVIIVDKSLNDLDKRLVVSTLLAHYILNYIDSEFMKDINKCFKVDLDIFNKTSREFSFGLKLLMPCDMFSAVYLHLIDLNLGVKSDLIHLLSENFEVKKSLVEERIKQISEKFGTIL
jgi:hypothetical protein